MVEWCSYKWHIWIAHFLHALMTLHPNLHLNNLRLHLKSIAIEEKGVGPWSSHKECKFLIHPCQMKFDYINVVLDCNNMTYNYPCSHQQWDSNFGIQWVLNFVLRSLYDLIVQCNIVEKWSNISPCKYLPNYGDILLCSKNPSNVTQPLMTNSLFVPQVMQMHLLRLSHICKPSFYTI